MSIMSQFSYYFDIELPMSIQFWISLYSKKLVNNYCQLNIKQCPLKKLTILQIHYVPINFLTHKLITHVDTILFSS